MAARMASRTECGPETSERGETTNETWAGEHSSYILENNTVITLKTFVRVNSKSVDYFVD